MFTKEFDKFVCYGDSIETVVDGFTFKARIEPDADSHIDDDDCYNIDQSVTGCDDKQFIESMKARQAWLDDEWFYCGVVISVSKAGIELDDCAASLWSIECNYPLKDSNKYLLEVANELLPEAIGQSGSRSHV